MAGPTAFLGDPTSLRQYLDAIGAHPLLAAEDEIELARTIEQGREAEARLARGPVGDDERRALEALVAAAGAARQRFVQCNQRLVVSVARRYQHSGVPLLDLIQEGNVGLLRAVEKFDHRRGFKFSTYATWWIRQAIGRAIADTSRTIRIPAHARSTIAAVRRSNDRLAEELDRAPTTEELAADTGLSSGQVEVAMRNRAELLSLSAPVGDDETELGDLLADDDALAPYEEAAAALEREALRASLELLTERERMVLDLRFGLDSPAQLTLAEIGEQLSLTRERIRQIEAKAMTKLRHPSTRRVAGGRVIARGPQPGAASG